jgi:RNA polymerase sigma-70 factor, ECF subfamily
VSELQTTIDAGRLYREHAPFVARFLVRMGVLAQDLDDLLQEVFLVAHRRGGFRQGLAAPSTWLAEIALRVASQRRRTQRRRPEASDAALAELAARGRSPAEALQMAESLARVQVALDGLDLEHRAVFVLFEIEGQDCAAIAAGLAIPIGTVHSRLHNARRSFEKAHARLAAREERTERLIPEVERA